MKRVIVKSVHGAFGYVMEHYYPFGMVDEAAWVRRQLAKM